MNLQSLVDDVSKEGVLPVNSFMRTRLILPRKGTSEAATLAFLAECGMKVNRGDPGQYLGDISSIPDLEVVFQQPANIPSLVEDGIAALGILDYATLAEYRGSENEDSDEKEYENDLIVLVRDLGYGHCSLVVAVPQTWIDVSTCADLWHLAGYYQTHKGRGLRIATKYPKLTEQFLRRHGIAYYKIISPQGPLEAALLTDTADLIVDINETETTLHEKHLKLLDDGVVLQSQACLVANLRLLRENEQALRVVSIMLELIDAHMQSSNRSRLTASIQGESIDAIRFRLVKLNQHLKSVVSDFEIQVTRPESTNSSESHWYTISALVNVGDSATELLETIAALRNTGAININIIPLSFHFKEESVSVLALRKRLKRLI